MSDTTYKPWRTSGEPIALVPDATRQWHDLVEESRRSISALRELREGIDQRLQAGLQVLKAIDRREAESVAAAADAEVQVESKGSAEAAAAAQRSTAEQLAAEAAANASLNSRITAIEERLAALENSINQLSAPRLSIRRDTDSAPRESQRGPDPLQHLLGDLLAAA